MNRLKTSCPNIFRKLKPFIFLNHAKIQSVGTNLCVRPVCIEYLGRHCSTYILHRWDRNSIFVGLKPYKACINPYWWAEAHPTYYWRVLRTLLSPCRRHCERPAGVRQSKKDDGFWIAASLRSLQ